MAFRLATVAGRAVLLDGDSYHDVEALGGAGWTADPLAAVARFGELHALAARSTDTTPQGRIADVVLGPPVPNPSKVFGIGLNYREHAEETGATLPPAPLTFTKFPSCLSGPTSDIVLSNDRVDWEVELVLVIGRGGRRIAAEHAWDHVAGVMVGQDISDRTLQRTGTPPQFNLGKSYDGYGPTGPCVVSLDQLPDRDDLALTCSVNDEVVQSSSTRYLIFDVPYLVSYLSAVCTLVPGDLIFTGTPSGVGAARGWFLKPGDVLTSTIAGVGTMVNRCVAD